MITNLKNYNIFPILYTNIFINLTKEHIYPRCYLSSRSNKDLHNIFYTSNTMNNIRSNYYFIENKSGKLFENNYICNKHKTFTPRDNDKGIISRAILYMVTKYKLSIPKIIDEKTIIKWFILYKPCVKEINHNNLVYKIQNNNNIFITQYDIIRDRLYYQYQK